MSRHRETNPHFERPAQQPRSSDRDRTRSHRSSPPPVGRDTRQNTPSPHHDQHHHHQPDAPHHRRDRDRDRDRGRRSTPPRTPVPVGIAPNTPVPHHHHHHRPEDGPPPHHDSNEHFPLHIQPPHRDENRPEPLGPDRPKHGGHFQSPWAIPPPRPHPAHHPAGNYQSPWIPPPSAHPADDRPLVTQPHRHDTAEQTQPPPHPHQQQPHGKHPRHHRDGRKHHKPTPPPSGGGHDPSTADGSSRRRHGRGPVVPSPRKTKISTWFAAVCCAIFWIAIFLAGIIILVVYLIYRPHNPRFEVSDATLNTAYLDAGSLLNADVSLLANFTNPNRKVGVDFGSLIVDLYYGTTLIATQFIQPFSAEKAGSRFVNLELVTSQVRIPLEESKKLEEEINKNTVTFNVKGVFRVRSQLGSFLAYSYKLYGHCTIVLTGPPSGVLRGRRCITKR
ncbi:NDR1/HIN1-like protein 13 [Linum grandiflorum]